MKSFRAALRGLLIAVRRERHMKIHMAAAAAVLTAAYLLEAEPRDWCVLIITCALVMAAELFNTAVERLCDKIDADECPYIKDVKDIAAGAVLLCAAAAVIAGIIIFWRLIF